MNFSLNEALNFEKLTSSDIPLAQCISSRACDKKNEE
jgi:hypothetical protein